MCSQASNDAKLRLFCYYILHNDAYGVHTMAVC